MVFPVKTSRGKIFLEVVRSPAQPIAILAGLFCPWIRLIRTRLGSLSLSPYARARPPPPHTRVHVRQLKGIKCLQTPCHNITIRTKISLFIIIISIRLKALQLTPSLGD